MADSGIETRLGLDAQVGDTGTCKLERRFGMRTAVKRQHFHKHAPIPVVLPISSLIAHRTRAAASLAGCSQWLASVVQQTAAACGCMPGRVSDQMRRSTQCGPQVRDSPLGKTSRRLPVSTS
jgi:hypothetical protein